MDSGVGAAHEENDEEKALDSLVRKLLDAAARAYSSRASEPSADLSDGTTEDQLIAVLDGQPVPASRAGPVRPPRKPSPPLDLTKEALSVREASQFLGVSPGTIYSRITNDGCQFVGLTARS